MDNPFKRGDRVKYILDTTPHRTNGRIYTITQIRDNGQIRSVNDIGQNLYCVSDNAYVLANPTITTLDTRIKRLNLGLKALQDILNDNQDCELDLIKDDGSIDNGLLQTLKEIAKIKKKEVDEIPF